MPQAWYNQAEAYFRLHGVTDRMFWFYYVQWALTPVQKKLARDLLSIPDPPPNAYELLKERLLRLYDKGEKDRCRRLLSMPPLGGRRPSELLAEMLQLCPRDDVDGKIIRYMFLFRLTPTMQSMLGEDDTSSITDLAARADALMDAEAAKEHAVAAAVEEATIAAAGVQLDYEAIAAEQAASPDTRAANDNSAEARVKDNGIQHPVGSDHQHHRVLHSTWC